MAASIELRDNEEKLKFINSQNGNANIREYTDAEVDEGRKLWNRKIEYFLSAVGYVIGYASLWRFPYMCVRNGGGAFLIPYFLFLFTLGPPLIALEVSLGQFSGFRIVDVWAICPLFTGIGIAMMTISVFVSVYYNVILTWVIYYLANSFYATLPWTTCGNAWNTNHCVTSLNNTKNSTQYFIGNISGTGNYTYNNITGNSSAQVTLAAEEYWRYNVLGISSGIGEIGGLRWQLVLCLLGAWVITYLCCIRGIRSAGKIVYLTAVAPYVLLFVLLVRALTQSLEGSVNGILYFFTPDFKHLLNSQVWLDACLQMFYSLGPAWGGLASMSSYNRFRNNSVRDAWFLCCVNGATMIFAGIVIFSILGFMALDAGLEVAEVATSGPGLIFVAYPEAISRLPIPQLWAVLFFLMLLTMGLDSQFATFETVVAAIADVFPKKRKRKFIITIVLAVMCFLMGLLYVTNAGVYWFQITDWYAGTFTVFLICLLESIVVSWIYGIGQFSRDIEMMIGQKPWLTTRITWCLVAPCLMLFLFMISLTSSTPPTYGSYHYPAWAVSVGWMLAAVSMSAIPITAIWKVLKSKGTLYQRLQVLITPTASWGPSSKVFKQAYTYINYRDAPSLLAKIKRNILSR